MGSKLVPSHPIYTEEVSCAIPKENPTPFFGVSRNFLLGDFLSLCGVERLLGLTIAGFGSASLLLNVGPEPVLTMLLSLLVRGVLRIVSSDAPTSVEQCRDSLTESTLLLLPCRLGLWQAARQHPLPSE